MNFEITLLAMICISTLIIMILHKIIKNKDNKLSDFINRIWYEWFEEQWNAIVAFGILLLAMIIISLIFI